MPTYRTWELGVNYKMGYTVLGTTLKETLMSYNMR